eukprot:scaffold4990_cov387-Prasinococcus_capsulatus_cf.AAC.38
MVEFEYVRAQKVAIAKLFEALGMEPLLSLLDSDDPEVQAHAVKVVANLAAERANPQKIVAAGGLQKLSALIGRNKSPSGDPVLLHVATGAVANLAMNEDNQVDIMNSTVPAQLIELTRTEEGTPTERMVAGALANLCGNINIKEQIVASGALAALCNVVNRLVGTGDASRLMEMSPHEVEVLTQAARGIANFARFTSNRKMSVLLDMVGLTLTPASKLYVPTPGI